MPKFPKESNSSRILKHRRKRNPKTINPNENNQNQTPGIPGVGAGEQRHAGVPVRSGKSGLGGCFLGFRKDKKHGSTGVGAGGQRHAGVPVRSGKSGLGSALPDKRRVHGVEQQPSGPSVRSGKSGLGSRLWTLEKRRRDGASSQSEDSGKCGSSQSGQDTAKEPISWAKDRRRPALGHARSSSVSSLGSQQLLEVVIPVRKRKESGSPKNTLEALGRQSSPSEGTNSGHRHHRTPTYLRHQKKRHIRQKKLQKEISQREKEELRNKAREMAGLAAGGEPVAVVLRKYNREMHSKMKGETYGPDDKIFNTFKRPGGKGSGIIYVLDADTFELVFALRIKLFKDMDREEWDMYQHIFHYFHEDRRFHNHTGLNGAMVAGKMYAMGWRKAMVKNEAYATYAPKLVHTQAFIEHSRRGKAIHDIYATQFARLAPKLYAHQVQQHSDAKVPAFGYGHNQRTENVFCSNLVYTRDDFENKGHEDNDLSRYTFGMGANVVATNSNLATFKDGYVQRGRFFYIADYEMIVDYRRIDGICEQIWQGPRHVHSTVKGWIKEGYTRVGSTAQINTRLAAHVRKFLERKDGKFVLDDEGRFLRAQNVVVIEDD